MSQKWPCEPHEQHQPAELEGRAKWLQGRPLQAQNRACSKHRACRSLMKTPNRLDAPFLFQAAWSRDFFNLGCLRAVQLGHGDQLSGRLADGGHLRKGAPHLRSRVGRRHTAAAQALQADPACLGRCLSWTCARRSTQGHRLVHHGYRRRSWTSTFSTPKRTHIANQVIAFRTAVGCEWGIMRQVRKSHTPLPGGRYLKGGCAWDARPISPRRRSGL